MRPYTQYSDYMPGYNPCLEASGYGVYGQNAAGGEAAAPNMPNMMPNMPGAMPSMCPPGASPYMVQEGDTLYNIARMYGTTIADILAANPSLKNANMLYIGQVVCIPAPASRPCPTGSMTYTVAQGDTLASIADRFSLSVYSLTIANPGFSADAITPGMRLCIAPFACMPACIESERYTIAEGEDLMKIAEKFQVSADDLLKANPFAPPCSFAPGNMICLPANSTMPAPAPTAQRSRK